jgi:hypothetical protein
LGTASLVFGVVSIGVGLIALGYGMEGLIQNLFYLTTVAIGSGIGLFILGGLLIRKFDKDRNTSKME